MKGHLNDEVFWSMSGIRIEQSIFVESIEKENGRKENVCEESKSQRRWLTGMIRQVLPSNIAVSVALCVTLYLLPDYDQCCRAEIHVCMILYPMTGTPPELYHECHWMQFAGQHSEERSGTCATAEGAR
jgi:hypothetical protein